MHLCVYEALTVADEQERRLARRIGGFTRARHDLSVVNRQGLDASRAALEQRQTKQVDPTDQLPPAERARGLEAAKSAYFATLAHRSRAARSTAPQLLAAADRADTELRNRP